METYNRPTEIIEKEGNPKKIWGIKSSKTFKSFLESKLKHFTKTNNTEYRLMIKGILDAYNHFEMKKRVVDKIDLPKFKGKSGIEIIEHPNYFEVISYQKTDEEIKEVKNHISIQDLKPLINAIEPLQSHKKYKTRYIAQEYIKCANMSLNSRGRAFFDENGFNFEGFTGDRKIYLPFNIMLNILKHYEFINYYKSGHIEKLKDKFDLQSFFKDG